MYAALLLLVALGASNGAASADAGPDRPETIVRAFIADYDAWNGESVAASKAAGDADAATMAQIKDAYRHLLDRYCRPGFQGQGIVFGERSVHGPQETIESVSTGAAEAVVNTKSVEDLGDFPFTSDYEYHLRLQEGRWYLEEVYYVDGNGKFPSL